MKIAKVILQLPIWKTWFREKRVQREI